MNAIVLQLLLVVLDLLENPPKRGKYSESQRESIRQARRAASEALQATE